MFSQAWKKYLPVIVILMKRSSTGEQSLDMNRTDFERAAAGRKAKLSFTINLHKGRIQNITNPPPVARELSILLQEDDTTRTMIRQYDFGFTMTSGFQLLIRNTTPPADEITEEGSTSESSE